MRFVGNGEGDEVGETSPNYNFNRVYLKKSNFVNTIHKGSSSFYILQTERNSDKLCRTM